jgi:tetratricopeptide (TPR) repeat protein
MQEDERYENIIKRFENMLKTNENEFFDLDEFLDIIDEYISLGNFNMAQKAIEIGLEQYENNVDILLYQAELYALNDQLDKAENLIKFIKDLEPGRLEIPLLEAEIYSRKHLHKKAIEALQRALQLPDVDKVEVYELMTVEYLYLENYKSALETALRTLQYDPDSATALYNAITCFDVLNQTGQAIRFLQKQIKVNPFNEVAWSLLAKKYIDIKDYEKAIEALDYAIAIDDKFLGAYYDKAYAYTQLKKYDKALEFYKLTLSIADPTAFTYHHIAQIYEQLQDTEQAVRYYLLAVNEDPGHYKSWKKIVQIYIKIKHLDKALEWCHKALEIINNQELFELLGDIYILRNETRKAIPAFEMSLKLGSLRLPIVLKLADLYKQYQQMDDWRSLLLEAKKQFPDSKEILNRMSGN